MNKKTQWDFERIRNLVLGILSLLGIIMGGGSFNYASETKTEATSNNATRDDRMTDMLLYVHKLEDRLEKAESELAQLRRHHGN